MEAEADPEELLASFKPSRIQDLVALLDDDDAADLIGDLEPNEQARVLATLPQDEASELRQLLNTLKTRPAASCPPIWSSSTTS